MRGSVTCDVSGNCRSRRPVSFATRCPSSGVRYHSVGGHRDRPSSADPPDWRHLHERSPRSRGRQWASLGDRPHIGLLVKGGSVGRARLSAVAIASGHLPRTDQRASCSRQSRAANATATRRDRIAPSLVTLWSHPWVSGRRFKPSTGPHLLFRSSGRYGHRIPATADAIGLSAGWCGSNERTARSTIRPERV